MFALVGVGRECCLRGIKLREEGKSHLASSGDLSMVDHLGPADQLPETVPIECGGIFEFRKEGFRIEPVSRLPELEHDETADERSVQGALGEDAEVIDVACFAALVAGPDLL